MGIFESFLTTGFHKCAYILKEKSLNCSTYQIFKSSTPPLTGGCANTQLVITKLDCVISELNCGYIF